MTQEEIIDNMVALCFDVSCLETEIKEDRRKVEKLEAKLEGKRVLLEGKQEWAERLKSEILYLNAKLYDMREGA